MLKPVKKLFFSFSLSAKQALQVQVQYYKLVFNILLIKYLMHDVICDVDYCRFIDFGVNGEDKCI